jgi:ribulose-5-phosphate 4-epimerase/fuculose-1-phosphate aldolase
LLDTTKPTPSFFLHSQNYITRNRVSFVAHLHSWYYSCAEGF